MLHLSRPPCGISIEPSLTARPSNSRSDFKCAISATPWPRLPAWPCSPSPPAAGRKPTKPKLQTRETLGKTTQEVRNLKPELAKGGQVTDGKIHATDYITIQADAYRTSVANIAKMKVKMDMDMYEALNGEKPKTYEEFMDMIIKKGKPDGIQLPMLPYYQEYGYDPDTKELVVIEYPEKKKAMRRAVGQGSRSEVTIMRYIWLSPGISRPVG